MYGFVRKGTTKFLFKDVLYGFNHELDDRLRGIDYAVSVGDLCPRLGVTYGRLTVRAARTRWGSCSQKGNINFNWKLMMAPEPVIDYVIIHELAHLKEMNHSKNFWKLVAEHCLQWRKHRKWLKEYESELASKLSG